MKKWIRWQGLGAFLAVAGILTLFWLLFVDAYVKRMIEKTGSKVVGAKVELADADLSLFPAGLALVGIQITDPDRPMTNAVEIARVSLSLDSLNLLRRKVIIEEMALEGVQLNTPRKTSGALVSAPDTAPAGGAKAALKKWLGDKMAFPSLEVRDAREILKNERLESMDMVQSLRAEIQSERENWQKLLRELPGKDAFDQYKDRIQKLKSSTKGPVGGMLSGAGDVITLQKEIQRDLNLIKGAQQDLNRKTASIRMRLDHVTKAPLKDIQRLKEKYSLSAQGISNMSRLIFGPNVGGWTQKAIVWYEKLRPVLERVKKDGDGPEAVKPMRGRGLDIRFKEHSPLPDFLIRQAKASVELQTGNLGGMIKNITPDQDILGTPLTFEFAGDNMKGFHSIRVNGAMNRVIPSRSKDAIEATVMGYEAQDVILSDNPELPVSLKHGLVDLQVNGLISADKISANLTAGLKSIILTATPKDGSSPLAQAIGSALSEISEFTVKAEVAGTLDEYDVQLSSDLDRALKNVAGRALKKQAAIFESELRRQVYARVSGPLGKTKDSLGGLETTGTELTSRLNLGNGLLGSIGTGSPASGFKLPF